MTKSPPNSVLSIKAGNHLEEALRRLSEAPTIDDGRVMWDGGKLDSGTFEIICSLKLNPAPEDHITDGAIWHALNECAKLQNFSSKYFLQRLRLYLNEWDKKSPQSLVGVVQINCKPHSVLIKSIRSFDGILEFHANLAPAERFALADKKFNEKEKLGLHDDFVYIITRTRAADHRSAIDRAERNIKFGLGTLNLIYRGYGISKRFGLPNAPIGRFLSASSTFLVDRQRRKIGRYFSDNNYLYKFKDSFSSRQQIDRDCPQIISHYVKNLKKIDFAEKVIQAVILIQEGLEATGIDLALLKFWTGIELLCSRDEKENSDRVVERASSIFTNPKYVTIRLQFIREFRNKIVHKGTSGDHAILCAQWGSIILAEVIRFSLFNAHNIRDHKKCFNIWKCL